MSLETSRKYDRLHGMFFFHKFIHVYANGLITRLCICVCMHEMYVWWSESARPHFVVIVVILSFGQGAQSCNINCSFLLREMRGFLLLLIRLASSKSWQRTKTTKMEACQRMKKVTSYFYVVIASWFLFFGHSWFMVFTLCFHFHMRCDYEWHIVIYYILWDHYKKSSFIISRMPSTTNPSLQYW